VTALDDDRCVEDYRRDGGQAEPRQGRDGQPGRERGPDSGRHAAAARRALPARGEHRDRVAREHAQRDQVGRPGGGERPGVLLADALAGAGHDRDFASEVVP